MSACEVCRSEPCREHDDCTIFYQAGRIAELERELAEVPAKIERAMLQQLEADQAYLNEVRDELNAKNEVLSGRIADLQGKLETAATVSDGWQDLYDLRCTKVCRLQREIEALKQKLAKACLHAARGKCAICYAEDEGTPEISWPW